MKKTLIIGLGNPILGDDGVGWRVAEAVAKHLPNNPDIQADCCSVGGLSLMERMTGYERVILIDSIFTGKNPAGTISKFALTELKDPTAGHTTSAHDTSLHNALNVGRSMKIPLPEDEAVTVVAIEVKSIYDFSKTLSPVVESAIPEALNTVLDILLVNTKEKEKNNGIP